MSSTSVRSGVLGFLASNSSESVVDLTGHFEDVRQLLADSGVTPDSPWLGVEFIGDGEEPVSLGADNEKGLYRETGTVELHVCAMAKIGVGSNLVSRGEILRNLFRGRRIGSIVVESVSPIRTGPGATLEFEAGYVSGTVSIIYHFDLSPGT